MAAAQPATKAPSSVQNISDKDMQTFIDVLNTLSLGPIYTQRSQYGVDVPAEQAIRLGGGSSGYPVLQRSAPATEEDLSAALGGIVKQFMPRFANVPDVTSGTEKPGVSLKDFTDILSTLNVQDISGLGSTTGYRFTGDVAQPGATKASEYARTTGYGSTKEEAQENLAKWLSDTIEFVAKFPDLFGGKSK